MYIVYTGVDGIERARKVESYREAGKVIAALEIMGVDPKFSKKDELMNPPISCLPIIVDSMKCHVNWSRTHIPHEMDITI